MELRRNGKLATVVWPNRAGDVAMQAFTGKSTGRPGGTQSLRRAAALFVVTLAMIALAALFLTRTSWGQMIVEHITGMNEDDMFSTARAMHDDLTRWDAPGLPPKPEKRLGFNNETQSGVIKAYFEFLTAKTLPPPASLDAPMTADSAFIQYLREWLPANTALEWPVDPRIRNGKGREAVLSALASLARTPGLRSAHAGPIDSAEFDAAASRAMDAIREKMDFRRWHAAAARTWQYNGQSPPDHEARNFVMRSCLPGDGDGISPDVESLWGLLRQWNGEGAPDRWDCQQRPWLVVWCFFEFLSVRRLGFDDESYDSDVIRLFPLDSVVRREALSREHYNHARASLEGMRKLAEFLGIEGAEGMNFNDLRTRVKAVYQDGPALRREERRVLAEASADSGPLKKLAVLIRQMRGPDASKD